MANTGVHSRGVQVPPSEEYTNDDQALVDTPLMDGSIRAALLQIYQTITTQAQATNAQAPAMTAKAN